MSAGGRKNDPIWNEFRKKANENRTGWRAICNKGNFEMQGVLERMRNHLDACPSREIIIDCDSNSGAESVNLTDSPKTVGKKPGLSKVSCNLDAFIVKTSKKR